MGSASIEKEYRNVYVKLSKKFRVRQFDAVDIDTCAYAVEPQGGTEEKENVQARLILEQRRISEPSMHGAHLRLRVGRSLAKPSRCLSHQHLISIDTHHRAICGRSVR